MKFTKFLALATVGIFGFIGVMAFLKQQEAPQRDMHVEEPIAERIVEVEPTVEVDETEHVDRIRELFTTGPQKLPIVDTVRYTSRVAWLQGRPAWITDYAAYYKTSRHFIARSLNGKPDYYTQKVSSGNKFNVFRKDKDFAFHLVVDVSSSKMRFYYHDRETNERVLLKTYAVGIGRKDEQSSSGYLTPVGKYSLGEKVAIYKPGVIGHFHDQEVEMIQVFGTRWIPFGDEVAGCSEDAKGYGIHGAPWYHRAEDGALVEDRESVSRYESDGCIRLVQEDMEELFSIVISKPTYIEIVRSFADATLPGVETE